MAQQTAVDWLFIQLYEKFEMKGDGMEMDKVFEPTIGPRYDSAVR